MRSYSKVFKAVNLALTNEVKVIAHPVIHDGSSMEETVEALSRDKDMAIEDYSLVQKAAEQAQTILESAKQHAKLIETAAQDKINLLLEENQQKLEAMAFDAKEKGFREGYETGRQEGVLQVQREYQEKLTKIQALLDQAYEQKEAIIAEAEPFLLELSTVIASQIIKQELAEDQFKFVELIKQHILRFKEKEHITVCVHPDQFPFIQSQRADLSAVVNGETEIKIIPDHSVTDNGCIIRTAYGSIDARIETQIEEIKKVILEARGTLQSDANN